MGADIQKQAEAKPAQTKKKPPETLREFLMLPENLARINDTAAKHIDEEGLVRLALMLATENEDIGKCDWTSVLKTVMAAAACGLEFGLHSTAQAYLVPFKNKCTLIPSYRGLMDLARRSGHVRYFDAQVVYDSDKFEIELGSQPRISHRPALVGERGPLVGVYAIAHMPGGGEVIEYMNRADVMKVRSQSASGQSEYSPWNKFFEEMARKCPIRRLCKRLPADRQLNAALQADDDSESIHVPVTATSKPRGTDAVARQLTGGQS